MVIGFCEIDESIVPLGLQTYAAIERSSEPSR